MTRLGKTVTRIATYLFVLFLGAALGVGVILWRQEYNPFTGNFGDGPQIGPEPTEVPPPVESRTPTPFPPAQPS
jgi:hypothetical protein